MTLADLKNIIAHAETFGFKDEDIEVNFTTGLTKLKLDNAKACVVATDAKAKPILTVTMSIGH